jgi:DNA-binding HxlR family transcriptional regulator
MLRSDDVVKKAPPRHLITAPKPRGGKRSADLRAAKLYDPNPYDAKCPTRVVLDRIGDKWTVLVLVLLSGGPRRFNQMRRDIDGVTQKMLSQTLKALERDGLVARKVTPSVPVTVEYSITPLGATLAATVDELQRWARMHIAEVITAQRRYDMAARS